MDYDVAGLLGTWDCHAAGRSLVIIVEPGTSSDTLTIKHPLVGSGAARHYKLRDFFCTDGTLQYERYRGRRVNQSEIWWEPDNIVWKKQAEAADRSRGPTGRARSSSGAGIHSNVDDRGHSSFPNSGAGRVRDPGASNPGVASDPRLLITEADIAATGLDVEQCQVRLDPEDKLRNQVREGTKHKVAKELGLGRWGDRLPASPALPYSSHLALFKDQSSYAHESPSALAGYQGTVLGRYDVLAVPCRADLDSQWRMWNGRDKRQPFLVLHAAALNVGESAHAHDFREYSTSHGLDAVRYVRDMGRIFENVLMAAESLGIRHLVWFPFGMGAFLRHLEKCDSQYRGGPSNAKSMQLRHALCSCFGSYLAQKRWSFKVFLLLSTSSGWVEADINTDSFVRALSSAGVSRDALKVYLGADSLELAQKLAAHGPTALLNGANRGLIGNHWFDGGARSAIDENLHRRSWLLSAFAYALNDFGGSRPAVRPPGTASDLESRVRQLGGKVQPLRAHDAGQRVKGGDGKGGDGKGAPAARPPSGSLAGAGKILFSRK